MNGWYVFLLLFIVGIEYLSWWFFGKHAENGKIIYLILGLLMYIIIGYAVSRVLYHKDMGTFNATWNVLSTIGVIILGILLFKEQITPIGVVGVVFGIISIILLAIGDGQKSSEKT